MDSVIKLIAETHTTNDFGVQVVTETEREVFARVESVTRAEFFQGGRNGLNPEFRFDVFYGDYNGERTVEYEGNRYSVYRAHRSDDQEYRNGDKVRRVERSDYLELYVERKGGSNGNHN